MTQDEIVDGITDSMDMFEQTPGDSEGQGNLMCCNPWGSQIVGHDPATEQQNPITKTLILGGLGLQKLEAEFQFLARD